MAPKTFWALADPRKCGRTGWCLPDNERGSERLGEAHLSKSPAAAAGGSLPGQASRPLGLEEEWAARPVPSRQAVIRKDQGSRLQTHGCPKGCLEGRPPTLAGVRIVHSLKPGPGDRWLRGSPDLPCPRRSSPRLRRALAFGLAASRKASCLCNGCSAIAGSSHLHTSPLGTRHVGGWALLGGRRC